MAMIQRYEPGAGVLTLRDAFDRLFDQAFVRPFETFFREWQTWSWPDLRSATSLYETEDAYLLYAPVPGVRPEDCEVTVQQNKLTIRCKRSYSLPERATPIWQGFAPSEEIVERMTLPGGINADQIEARIENGVLMVRMPKAESLRPKRIPVHAEPVAH